MSKSFGGKSAARKPLRDLSNGGTARQPKKMEGPAHGGYDGAVDRLLLVRSDVANVVSQIDELVAQAIERKTANNKSLKDIDSFRNFLSDMHSSLKEWSSRFQETLVTASAECGNLISQSLDNNVVSVATHRVVRTKKREPDLELVVSPSPLVSWRAGACTVDCGRQLFLLTPLPKQKVYASRFPESSKSMVRKLDHNEQFIHHDPSLLLTSKSSAHGVLSGRTEVKPEPRNVCKSFSLEQKISVSEKSPLNYSNHKNMKNSILTQYSRKGSALSDPVFDPFQLVDAKDSDNCKSEEVSEGSASKYQELLGLQLVAKFTSRRKEVDENLNWFLSPPKTCALMEPSDEKPLPTPANSMLSLGTSFWKDLESSYQGKQPGEATLKRELWTKFEAVSSSGLQFDVSSFQKVRRKGFLDMLEEVSCETACSDSSIGR